MSETKKVYKTQAKKATKSSVNKAAVVREKRRQVALTAFSINELVKRLQLQRDSKALCPKCKQRDTLTIGKHEFKCKSCKQKGHTIKLVKLTLGISDWKAIAYIENLAKEKTAKTQPTTKPNLETKPTPISIPKTNIPIRSSNKERIQKTKQQNKISDIVTKYTNASFKKTGNAILCRCPFPDHEDKTPSFSVNDKKGVFNCFGCSKNGDVISFVQQYKNCSFKEALNLLDPIPLAQKATVFRTISKSQLIKRCVNIFEQTLQQNQQAQTFLRDRGIFDGNMAQYFSIGYDDGAINQLLQPEHVTTLSEVGIINGNEKCRFYRSLTVPLWDAEGNVVSIYGRRIQQTKTSGKHQFCKGNFSGLFNATVFKAVSEVILTEGVIDALSLWTLGFENVSCIFSASNIPNLLIDQLVKHQIRRVYLAFDNDSCGNKACINLQQKLQAFSIEVMRIEFPEGIKDANELLVKYGKPKTAEIFSSLLEKAKPLVKKENIPPQKQNAGSNLQIQWSKRQGRATGCLDYEIELIARERGAMRVLIIATHNNNSHTDKLDLFRSQARASFANSAARRFDVASAQVENELEQILLYLRKLPGEALGKSASMEEYVTTYTAKERKQAQQWLASKGFFETIPYDYDLIGYIGEKEAKQIAYLSASSRKLSNPIPLIIRATSAGGKSALMDATAKLMPDEDALYLSEISKQALYYMTTDKIQHKLVIIDERKGSEDADYSIRTLLSRGILRKAVPSREVDGEIRTVIKELHGPISYMESTTDVNIHPENENRCLTLYLDDSPQQNKRIHQAQRQCFTAEGREKQRQSKEVIQRHKVAQKLLKPCLVDIPYVNHLTFPITWCRTRRDHQKFLWLLSTIAYLHQYQRKTYVEKNDLVVVSELEDYEIAYKLAPLVLRPSVSDLTDKHHELLKGINDYVDHRATAERKLKTDVIFTRSEIVRTMKWQIHQIKSYLPRLVEMEYLLVVGSMQKGATHKYQRNYQVPDEGNPMTWLIPPDKLQNTVETTQESQVVEN
ncbi:CHC2 zinc finger domain-containing protein [Candidatus Uabimicrobium sp. HlEnr_7]|uniref:CHC2 zinc finger domain-containing protein n=1 Tax=Candidatus Uabimicrobium helgolandensis TaxID=3095367 RepID=UPI00355628D9